MTLASPNAASAPNPVVSVVMPLYNAEKYLRESIDSIVAQTFHAWELVIVADPSTDSSIAIAKSYTDPRIRLVENDRKVGLAGALNRGIEVSRGIYVARMDADDVSRPERLARQVAFLEAHPRCGIVGTWTEILSEGTPTGRSHRHPIENLEIKYHVLFDSPFVHPSVMMRAAVFAKVGSYPSPGHSPYPEDLALWSRIARAFDMANLAEPLLLYREVAGSESRKSPVALRRHVSAICADNIAFVLGAPEPDQTIAALADYIHDLPAPVPSPIRMAQWIGCLFRCADSLSDATGAPRGRLRRRAASRAQAILQKYRGQVRTTVMAQARDLMRSLGYK